MSSNKILVIPDVHLKPWMFTRAAELMEAGEADHSICLMDLADDWRQQFNLELYAQTYDAALWFAAKFPDSFWCLGNHDLAYVWNQRVPGYSKIAPRVVCDKIKLLKKTVREEQQVAYIHKIGDVLFSHGGLPEEFVRDYVPEELHGDVGKVVEYINSMDWGYLWQDISPIWYRPQIERGLMYRQDELLQVVGHTPVRKLKRRGNLISCDLFSTREDGSKIGTEEFLILDLNTWDYKGVR